MPAAWALLAVLAAAAAGCARQTPVLGFWFEDVSFSSPMLGGPLTAADRRAIENVAREELAIAFRDFDVTLTGGPEARYRVRVTQNIFENRTRRRASSPASLGRHRPRHRARRLGSTRGQTPNFTLP